MFKKILAYLLLVTFSFSFSEWIFANYLNKNNTSNYTTNNSKVIIYENWVSINWKYYTKNEFENLLKKAVKISDDKPKYQTRFAPVLSLWINPWTYFVAWIWAITIARDWIIWIWWQAISAWSWLYDKVVAALSSIVGSFSWSSSIEQEYNNAKRECRPNKNNNLDSNTDRNWFGIPTWKEAFSTITFFKEWRLAKIRYFDKYWNAELDIHFEHPDDWTHEFPHCHKWVKNSKNSMSPLKWFPCCK